MIFRPQTYTKTEEKCRRVHFLFFFIILFVLFLILSQSSRNRIKTLAPHTALLDYFKFRHNVASALDSLLQSSLGRKEDVDYYKKLFGRILRLENTNLWINKNSFKLSRDIYSQLIKNLSEIHSLLCNFSSSIFLSCKNNLKTKKQETIYSDIYSV